MPNVTLVPAYGRDYKTAKALLADLNADKDFVVSDFFSSSDGKPCTPRRDFAGYRATFRYNGLAKIKVVML